MSRIALFGAGGKMGLRCARNLANREPEVDYVEISPGGIDSLRALGVEVTPGEVAASRADVVILAVPDRIMKKVAREVVPAMKKGALLVILDPAAPHGGMIPPRSDIGVFVTHPCHPPVVNDETTLEAKRDFYGGSHAKQSIVCALHRGEPSHYEIGEAVAKRIFAPVSKAHRVTVEQMAILEPAMAETVTLTLMYTIREALDEAVKAGVPEEIARDFLLGHMNVNIGILFGYLGVEVSDGAKRAVERGRKLLLRDDWREVFRPENVMREVMAIVEES